jgi:hypothetical protein
VLLQGESCKSCKSSGVTASGLGDDIELLRKEDIVVVVVVVVVIVVVVLV